jgi:hypothetical protein
MENERNQGKKKKKKENKKQNKQKIQSQRWLEMVKCVNYI